MNEAGNGEKVWVDAKRIDKSINEIKENYLEIFFSQRHEKVVWFFSERQPGRL